MKKKSTKTAARKTSARGAAKRVPVKASKKAKTATVAAKLAKVAPKKSTPVKVVVAATPATASDGKLTFNHAMIYCKDVERAHALLPRPHGLQTD